MGVWISSPHLLFAFEHKFKDFETVRADDSFGYMAQGLDAKARDAFGGWIVINKSTGQWKFIEADNQYQDEYDVIKDTVDYIATDAGFERCLDEIDETFRKVPTGNKYIAKDCTYCDYGVLAYPAIPAGRSITG